jgi:hypothetical protein
VDFIGGEKPLTKEDEKAFTEYLKKKKLTANIKTINLFDPFPKE